MMQSALVTAWESLAGWGNTPAKIALKLGRGCAKGPIPANCPVLSGDRGSVGAHRVLILTGSRMRESLSGQF